MRPRPLPWLWIAPALALVAVVALVPFLETLWLSTTDAQRGSSAPIRSVGFAHYGTLLRDGDFLAAARNTVFFTVVSVSVELALGLAIAAFLNREFRGRRWLRAALLIPWAIPTVVSARLWGWMYHDVFGVVNDLLVHRLGVLDGPLAWTATRGLAMGAAIAADVWKTTPFMALILLAGMQSIPTELHEAARVDGAGPWQRFRHVTLPLLRPALYAALLFRTLDAMRAFDVVWVLTGGRFGTELLTTYTYRQLASFNKLGLGAAAGVLTLLAIVGMLLAVRWVVRPRDAERVA